LIIWQKHDFFGEQTAKEDIVRKSFMGDKNGRVVDKFACFKDAEYDDNDLSRSEILLQKKRI